MVLEEVLLALAMLLPTLAALTKLLDELPADAFLDFLPFGAASPAPIQITIRRWMTNEDKAGLT